MTAGKRHLSELTDTNLAAALAAGEVDAVDVLYRRYGGDAYSLAVRILGDAGRAEDAVQDAFVRAWKRAASSRPPARRRATSSTAPS